ncbi:DUF1223 domain-containing protein [Pontiella agarivorans]|uniref:DUF1223 domain-containing protein n=1 Tax=Pontiella agarivorans TaxID=3038953 RepID=A0ABU5MW98_9BACT|nr:DUF1223 domain-containing protein [Pontiella agarivorans]MDZ8118366.1 DUF1223 domain-containing protein [Pontiella agarivorans]
MKSLFLIPLALSTASALAGSLVFQSPAYRVSLIELYTSEGCCSCPPAEQKMNSFAGHQGLWNDFVPVAFHVDYWNYLGWEDRFSNPDFSTRQRTYSKQWKARTVYTPCFVTNGNATRHPIPKAGKTNPGILKAELSGRMLSITFKPTKKHSGLKAWAAPLSDRQTTAVQSGENRGRTLEHCFVALDLNETAMTRTNDIWTAELRLNNAASALAVWVSSDRSLEPIQATGGWLEP